MDTETVTRVRPPGKDRFGDPLPGVATELDIPGCLFAPGSSGETHEGANRVDTDGVVYTPPAQDVAATDQLRIRGALFNVVGTPQDWGSAGLVIPVRRVTG